MIVSRRMLSWLWVKKSHFSNSVLGGGETDASVDARLVGDLTATSSTLVVVMGAALQWFERRSSSSRRTGAHVLGFDLVVEKRALAAGGGGSAAGGARLCISSVSRRSFASQLPRTVTERWG